MKNNLVRIRVGEDVRDLNERILDFNAKSVLIQTKSVGQISRNIGIGKKMQRFWSYCLYLVQNKKSERK